MKGSSKWMFLLSGFFFIAISSCANQTSNQTKAEDWGFDTLAMTKTMYIDNDSIGKGGMELNLSFVYPTSAPNNVDLAVVQNTFARLLLQKPDFSESPQSAFDLAKQGMIAKAEELAIELKGWGIEDIYTRFSVFEDNVNLGILAESEHTLSVELFTSSYTGGAHGIYNSSYCSIDKRDGTVITEDLLFKPDYEAPLSDLIQHVITTRNSASDESEHILLLGELNEVEPNENFYFSKEGLVYAYNVYEIAPYVQGVVEIVIPYNQIEPLINTAYLPVIEDFKN